MKDSFRIGDRVVHTALGRIRYGAGTIKGIRTSQVDGRTITIADVFFDIVPEDKKQLRSISVNCLAPEKDESVVESVARPDDETDRKSKSETKCPFDIGDYVSHPDFGNGIVQFVSAQKVFVFFENGKQQNLKWKDLVRSKIEVITEPSTTL